MTDTHTRPVVLITGAARRIGAATAETLHRAGYNIVAHCHQSIEQARQLVAQLNQRRPHSAVCLQADLRETPALQTLARQTRETWGRVDALVNNASTFYPTPLDEADEHQWRDLMSSNLKAPFFLSQQLLSALRASGGSIINITDVYGERPKAQHSIYCMAKAGNSMLTQALALELAPEVRVNGIAPGSMLWPEHGNRQPLTNTETLASIPMKRLGGAEAIAQTVKFLLTDNPYITGEIIKVDGGKSLVQP